MNKHILMIFSDLTKGGQYERLIKDLLDHRVNLKVIAITPEDSPFCRDYRNTSNNSYVEFHFFTPSETYLLPLCKLLLARPSTLLTSGWSASRFAILLGKFFRVENIVYVRHHGRQHYSSQLSKFQSAKARKVDRVLQALSDTVIAVSKSQAKLIESEVKKKEKVVVISNSYFNVSEITYQKHVSYKTAFSTKSLFRMAVVSRMTHLKGVHLICDAIKSLSQDFDGLELILVGARSDAWPLVKETLRDSRSLRWSHLEYIDDMKNFYNSIDCLVHAPLSPQDESFGLVMAEALYAGVPLVATNCGFLTTDEVSRAATYVIPEFNSVLAIENTLRVLLNDEVPKVLSQYQRALFESQYSIDSVSKAYRRLLNQLY